jgi:hypothetical protein
VSGACSRNCREKKECIQDFGGKVRRKETIRWVGNIKPDHREDGLAWARLIWLRIWTKEGYL